jgi:hypothetical protein
MAPASFLGCNTKERRRFRLTGQDHSTVGELQNPATWRWVHQPVWPNALLPDGLPGLLLIGDMCYLLTPHIDTAANQVRGFRLTTSDGTKHDIDVEHCRCACRGDGCPPAAALRAALVHLHPVMDDPEWDEAAPSDGPHDAA